MRNSGILRVLSALAGLCLAVGYLTMAPPPDASERQWGEVPSRAAAAADENAPSDTGVLSRSRVYPVIRDWLVQFALNGEALKLYAKWVVGAPTLVVLIVLAMLLRPRRKPVPPTVMRPRPVAAALPASRPRAAKTEPAPRAPANLSGRHLVVGFFLDLFRHQQEAAPDALAQFYRVETRPGCPDEIFEMRIMHQGDWVTRRMSIGLLGQGGGSRSKCFYVIYDTHMVIKIPAAPIERFADYKRQIAAERHIVARLAPRECIVPRVSVILDAVHTFPEADRLTVEDLERRYVHLLETRPELQNHVKIDGSFAFFMDLAKHYFLNTIVEEIHSGYGRLSEEALDRPELLWDQHGFLCRYGEQAGPVCHALQEIYMHCEGPLRRLVSREEDAREVPTYHLRQWFLAHLVGDTPRASEYGLSEEAMAAVNTHLGDIMRQHVRQVEHYRGQLRGYIRETRFSRYRRQVEALSANLLDLLAWIGRKGLAMRDLKPENLFVAGNPDEYPAFLNNPTKFTIGLIDVETAVVIDVEDPIFITQPQLAGTPLYATPAHLMTNVLLMEAYDDLAQVLHLQDWHATIAIIYKLITGEHLFAATAHVFPEIISALKALDPAEPSPIQDVIRIQRLFWNSAAAEFQEGMEKHAKLISRVSVNIPSAFVAEMTAELRADIAELHKAVTRAASEQSFFNSGDKRRYLKEASAEKITHMKNRLVQDREMPQDPILLYFELFEKLKTRLEEKELALAAMSTPNANLRADQLLHIMFQRVFTTMYPSHWPALAPAIHGRRFLLDPEITTYQATL